MNDGPAAPGWYHAQGDPLGTSRWWNGSSWVGDPQRAVNGEPLVSFPAAPGDGGGRADGDLSPIGWMLFALRRWNDIDSRATRSEYWWLTAGYLLVVAGLMTSGLLLAETGTGLSSAFLITLVVFVLAMLVPMWTVSVRRLHDIGKSGWWLLLGITPIVSNIGSFVLLFFFCRDSEKGRNEWGESPKYALSREEKELARARRAPQLFPGEVDSY